MPKKLSRTSSVHGKFVSHSSGKDKVPTSERASAGATVSPKSGRVIKKSSNEHREALGRLAKR